MAQVQLNQKLGSNATSLSSPNTRELKENLKNVIREETKPEKNVQDQDFFLCDDSYTKKKKREYNSHDVFAKKYNNTRIMARILLTNIAYSWLNKSNHLNRAFVVNIYTLLTQSLNPFSLDRKFNSLNDQQMIYMLWE